MSNYPEMNIYEKMSSISSELTTVKKNLSVNVGRSSYKAVGEADVLAAVKPLEYKYGIYSYPAARKVIDSGNLILKTSYNGKDSEKSEFFMRVEATYRFVNVDKPSEMIEITAYGDGVDTGDKAPGKAQTYADKYALLKAYKIITGDDPDQYASPEDGYEVAPPMPPRCEKCGALLEGMTKNGKYFSAEKVALASQKNYGKILCQECRDKIDRKNHEDQIG